MSEYHEKVSKCLSEVFDSINVLAFPNEMSLPLKKTRKSFDGYKPLGLMKRNWMKKHQVCFLHLFTHTFTHIQMDIILSYG